MPRKVFTAGEILTAANLNDVSDQSVMVFDDASARTTAIPTPVEGMVTYLKDDDEVTVFDGSAFKAVGPGKILQVVSTVKTDTFTTASTTFVDVTDLSATITPSATANKVLVLVSVPYGHSADGNLAGLTLADGSNNNLVIPDSPGSRTPSFVLSTPTFSGSMHPSNFSLLHSPATTSAFTYKIRANASGGTTTINRSSGDEDAATRGRGVATITLMEVAG